jgi:hypothetical protein
LEGSFAQTKDFTSENIRRCFDQNYIHLTTDTPINSPQNRASNHDPGNQDEWPSLPKSTMKVTPAAWIEQSSGVQNSNSLSVGHTKMPLNTRLQLSPNNKPLTMHPKPKQIPGRERVLVGSRNNKAWFYPSTGLSEFFSRAGMWFTYKAPKAKNPNPKLQTPPKTQRRRHTFIEIVKMASGGDGGGRKNDEESRGATGARGQGLPNNGGMGSGAGAAGRGGFIFGRHPSNRYGNNPGRGRSYGGYARGWNRPPHRGYRYTEPGSTWQLHHNRQQQTQTNPR